MPEVPRAARFAEDTRVVPAPERPGCWLADLSAEWSAPVVPQGGFVAAVAARAMTAALDVPTHRLRSLTTVFAAPVRAGPAEIEVTVLRRGRSLAQVAATIRSVGADAGATSLAVFGSARPGFEFTDVVPPVVPPPEESIAFREAPPDVERRVRFTYWDHVDGRIARGHPWWAEGWHPTTSERTYWYRFEEPPLVGNGMLDPLALVTLCDSMPGAIAERMGPGLPFWLPPSADLTVHLLGDAGPGWLLANNRARHAGDGYASAEMTLWDPERGLVAYATQIMCFTFPDGPPPRERRRPPVR